MVCKRFNTKRNNATIVLNAAIPESVMGWVHPSAGLGQSFFKFLVGWVGIVFD